MLMVVAAQFRLLELQLRSMAWRLTQTFAP
jgi:hypothetical protein